MSDRQRSSVILYAQVTDQHGPVECRVRNLSPLGACIDNTAGLAPGQTVRVLMGALREMEAEVMWAKPTLAGLRFDRPVDLATARRPRNAAAPAKQPGSAATGWLTNIHDAYHR